MRKFYFITFLLVTIGGFAGYFLIPKESEIALINLKDKRFAEAQASYEKQLLKGNLEPEVAHSLVDLYLQNGRIDDAIAVMEQFVKLNPSNVDARRKLGTLYQYAQRPEDYQRNLEEMSVISPDDSILKELSDIYNSNSQYDKQIAIIKDMIEKRKVREPRYYTDLANLLAAQRKFEEALGVLVAFKQAYPENYSYEQVELTVSLMMDLGKYDDAFKEAEAWLLHEKNMPAKKSANPEEEIQQGVNPEHVARLANIIHYKGSPKLAFELINPYIELAKEGSNLQAEIIRLQITNGERDVAYKKLTELYKANNLRSDLYIDYINLAIANGETKIAENLVKEIDLNSLGESELIGLTELGATNKNLSILSEINKSIQPETRARKPLFDAILAITNKEQSYPDKVSKIEANPNTSSHQRIQLATSCARSGDAACALRILKQLPDVDNLSDQLIADIGELYLQNKQYEEGYKFIRDINAKRNKPQLDFIQAKLAAASGMLEFVEGWLEKHQETADINQISEIYYYASNAKSYDIAAKIAEVLWKREKNEKNTHILATAYLNASRYEDALPLLRETRSKSRLDEDNYLTVLYKLSRKNPKYRQELKDFIAKVLTQKDLSEDRRKSLIFALLENGGADVAMPYIRSYALAGGGSWGSVYEKYLKDNNKISELREYRFARIEKPNSTIAEKRNYGFAFLNEGNKADAANVFKILASKGNSRDKDAKQLIYIWGNDIGKEQVKWLESQAAFASGDNFTGWLEYIDLSGNSESVVNTVEKKRGELKNIKTAEIYLRNIAKIALSNDSGNMSRFDSVISDIASSSNSEENMIKLAELANNYSRVRVSRAIYEKVLDVNPQNLKARREIGIIAYSQADYSSAQKFLGEYISASKVESSVNPDDYLVYFYYAECLSREYNKLKQAKKPQDNPALPFYSMALESADSVKEDENIERKTIAARSLARLDDIGSSKQRFNELKDENQTDKIIKADFAATMIDSKRFKEAREILNSPDNSVKKIIAAGSISIPSSRVVSSKISQDKRSITVTFNTESEKVNILSSLRHNPPKWLGYYRISYDSLYVSAKENYFVSIEKTASNINIGGYTNGRILEGEALKQADLRLHLLQARVDLATGRQHQAVKNLGALLNEYPSDAQLLGFMGNAQNFDGNWRGAVQALEQANKLTPENEDVSELLADVKKANAQHLKLSSDWRALGDNNEIITGFSGFAYVQPYTRIGFNYEMNSVDGEQIRRANGAFGDFDDDKKRFELYLRHDFENGERLTASLYTNNDDYGVGLRFGFLSELGLTEIAAEYQKPYWEFVEGILDDATRDRIEISQKAKIGTDLTITGAIAANSYNVDGYDGVATSVSFNGSVIYAFLDQPYLAVGYALDAEYRTDETKLIDIVGDEYSPFPFVSREVHFLNLIGHYDFTERTYLDGYAGFAIDRLEGAGPSLGFALTHEITETVDAQIRGSHGISFSDSGSDVTRFGGHLLWRF